jgi:hypothetical protein
MKALSSYPLALTPLFVHMYVPVMAIPLPSFEAHGPTEKLSRAASYLSSASIQSALHNQIEPRYKGRDSGVGCSGC